MDKFRNIEYKYITSDDSFIGRGLHLNTIVDEINKLYEKLTEDLSIDSLTFNSGGVTITEIEDSITDDATKIATSSAIVAYVAAVIALINHDDLLGYVANEHIDWTSALTEELQCGVLTLATGESSNKIEAVITDVHTSIPTSKAVVDYVGGKVDIGTTPVATRLAIWEDITTIEGDINLTWDGTTLHVGADGTGALTVVGATRLSSSGADIIVGGNILPITDVVTNLGSPSKKFAELNVAGLTLYTGATVSNIQTTISSTNDSLPTSKGVIDYIESGQLLNYSGSTGTGNIITNAELELIIGSPASSFREGTQGIVYSTSYTQYFLVISNGVDYVYTLMARAV